MAMSDFPPLTTLLLHLGEIHSHLHIWVLVIAGVLANIIFYAASGVGLVARRSLRRSLEVATGLAAGLGRVTLPVRSGSMTIRDLRLELPGADSNPPAVSVEEATLELTLGSLLRDEVHIPTVDLEGVVIYLPLLPGADGGTDPATAPASDERRYRVGEVRVSGLRLHAASGDHRAGNLPGEIEASPDRPTAIEVDSLTLRDIGRSRAAGHARAVDTGAGGASPEDEASEQGVPLPDLIRELLNRLGEPASTRTDHPQAG
jgi:hypothetical protein